MRPWSSPTITAGLSAWHPEWPLDPGNDSGIRIMQRERQILLDGQELKGCGMWLEHPWE